MSLSVDFISGLYNKHSCYADRLTQDELSEIHIPTGLDASLRKWLAAKKDIVLLGNPGDGKTHLIRLVEDVIKRVNAEVVLDATAEKDYGRLVRKWKAASEASRPFCLAINQGPLNQLLADKSGSLPQLDDVAEQLRSLIYYEAPLKQPQKVIVVDLNLRSVLSRDIIQCALKNILRNDVLDGCPEVFDDETSDGSLNRAAMSNGQVQERIIQLLTAASYTGHHVSMRDLQGFLSYLLLGGRSVKDLVGQPSDLAYRYFNLCFEGEGELFDAIREVFEPERATLPTIDEHLWENTGVRDGWLFGRPPFTPDHLEDAWELFTTLKRQYFFEHADGGKLIGLQRDDNAAFLDLLSTGGNSLERHLPTVLKAINAFFCPERDEDGMTLRLWGSQQYDGHSPRVLVSCYQIPREKFQLQVPQLAPWLTGAMDYRPDHLLLRYKGDGGSVGLRINRGLWRALALALRGMPLSLRSPQYAVALQTFITQLYRLEANPQTIENAFIYNIGLGRVTRVTVDRHNGVYVRQ
ncbi:hypothetical protein LBMAG46_20420 [Planctomycetia bacterium]|nr:hypothetical protein LBMAG46_20420 [Planctomycetia bacterium]